MANEVVRQHNDLIDLPLRNFNASEIDILLALCHTVQDKQTNEVVLNFSDIKKLSHYQNKNSKQFLADLKSTNAKLMALNFTIGDEQNFTQFVLFPTFEVSSIKGTLTVRVNEQFTYLLNDLTGNYTALELKESNSLNSSYAKQIYKKLREFRLLEKPLWKVPVDDFRTYLDIPKGFNIGKIKERVINPSIERLKPFFEGLKVEPYYEKNTGKKGRPKVAGYEFTFKSQKKIKPVEDYDEIKAIAKATGWNNNTGFKCPNCGKDIWEKTIQNENGSFILLGHPDWKTGGCDWHTNTYEDLHRAVDKTEETTDNQFTDEDIRENKKRLSNIFDKLFK